jgi:acetyl-CoA carboxylase carboxyltransferase component
MTQETRKNIELLVDPGSFVEFGGQAAHRVTAFGMARKRPPGDAVVTGIARIDERPVALFAQDPSSLGGSLGEVHAAKIGRMADWAVRVRAPLVGLLDSGGARIQEGVSALDGYGRIFRANVALSGKVPQLSVVLGTCAGGAVYSPALTDIVIMAKDRGSMFLTGPKVVKAVTHEDVTADQLGGADVHSRHSGTVHLVAQNTTHALDLVHRLLGFLPGSCWERPPAREPAEPGPLPAIPANSRHAYDVRAVIRGLADTGEFLELQDCFARNLVIGLGRIEGSPVGFLANQPQALAGVLDIASAEKGARFVRFCDAFGIPLVALVDTPGFLPGTGQELGGVIRKGAKLLYAFAEASVPRVTIVLRKAFGGAYIVMNSKSLGADAVIAWPGAQLAVMGAEGAIDIIYRREIAACPDSRDELTTRYQAEAMAATIAAERFSIDDIVRPEDTRRFLARTLLGLAGANVPRFRHDNLPQ